MARSAATVLILWLCLPEALQAGVVLEAGEIDSSKVRVGAFAEVVYGKGEQDPFSGQWEKLYTASGYIKAVDAEGLTLGRGLWRERIAFARIQRLILAESRREMTRLKNTMLFARAESGGMVLEVGEIDSGKVRVGAFAEVVYGKGKRDPVSGQWEKLVTASGYIKAVGGERLTLAVGKGALKEQIAFVRIQRLILAESSGVVLEAGEIDSGKVRVGAFVEVVYGKGKRDPVFRLWEKLDTARGYIKAVDAEGLTLALRQGLGKKRIAFARIQKLLLAASSRDMAKLKKATGVELPLA